MDAAQANLGPAKDIHKQRTVKGVLEDTYRLLITEGRWLQGEWHVDSDGEEATAYLPDGKRYWEESCPANGACCFCLDGALGIVSAQQAVYKAAFALLTQVIRENFDDIPGVIDFNDWDSTTQDQIAKALKLAIAEAE